MLEPFSCNEEPIASIAGSTTLDSKFLHPWLSVIFAEVVTDRVVTSDETEVTIERIIFLEIGVVSLIDGSVGFELLVDLLE